METAIRWSPNSTVDRQSFLLVDIAERGFRHCRVKSYNNKDLKYEVVSSNLRAPAFKAFDWSPLDESIVAVGEGSGTATVLRLDDEQAAPLLLPVKQQRACNAIAFSANGLLANGLERVRGGIGLNVWDISHHVLTPTSPVLSPGRSSHEPTRKLAISEGISSIRFFNTQPDTLLAGVKGACIRLYDLREHSGNAVVQFQTTAVHDITIDYLNENYFASAITQKDTTVQIWDRRFGSPVSATTLGSGSGYNTFVGPVLEYKRVFENARNVPQPTLAGLHYCRGKSGYLGALASNGDFKVYETRQAYASDPNEVNVPKSWVQQAQPQQDQLRTTRVHHISSEKGDARYNRQQNARVLSFDFLNLAGELGTPAVINIRANRAIEIYELRGPPPIVILSPAGELVGGGMGERLRVINAKDNDSLAQAGLVHIEPFVSQISATPARHIVPLDSHSLSNGQTSLKNAQSTENVAPLSSREKHEQWFEDQYLLQAPSIEAALASLTTIRRRCMEGYLFDCQKNMEIVAEDMWLQEMWDWIAKTKRLAVDETFMVRGIDLSYLGIYNIWNVDLGPEKVARISGNSENTDISYAIEATCRSLGLPELSLVETALPAHRRLCLFICGFILPDKTSDIVIRDLIKQEEFTKAAALALIHNQSTQAINVLKSDPASSHRELLLALAGFVKGSTDDTWSETIQAVATSLSDPYARAILAFVRTGSWHDVLSETSLPLSFRLGIALMYLTDENLTSYISTQTAECVTHGDIEGIILTGLSWKAVPLFQSYILKYNNDIQTAILALSHTCPRYFPSPLVDTWREEYRAQLNTHRLFIPRVRFDTGATKLSIRDDNKPTLNPPPRQVSIKCSSCEQPLDRNPQHISSTTPPPPPPPQPASYTATGSGSIFTDAKTGTVCPKCGAHLPRCVICMLWLGTPDPHSKAGALANAKLLEDSEKGRNGDVKGKGRRLMKEMI
ncbi:MAG: hypothetical protein Q9222_005455, partial [Ikaeria aurantiellina]